MRTARSKTVLPEAWLYHVDWDEMQDRWDVLDNNGRHLGHCVSSSEAIDLAINEALHDHGRGARMTVCLQDKDGSYRVAWSS